MAAAELSDVARFQDKFQNLKAEVGKVLVGQEAMLHKLLLGFLAGGHVLDRKSTRLNSSHLGISYAVFCLKKKKKKNKDKKDINTMKYKCNTEMNTLKM